MPELANTPVESTVIVVSVVLMPSESFIFVYLLTNGGVGVMYCVTSILSKNAKSLVLGLKRDPVKETSFARQNGRISVLSTLSPLDS